MLYELFLVLRVLFYQFLEFISFNNKLNYIEELKKTIEKYNKISNNAVSRTTNDIGTLFRKNYKNNEGFSLDNLNGIIDIDVKNKTVKIIVESIS